MCVCNWNYEALFGRVSVGDRLQRNWHRKLRIFVIYVQKRGHACFSSLDYWLSYVFLSYCHLHLFHVIRFCRCFLYSFFFFSCCYFFLSFHLCLPFCLLSYFPSYLFHVLHTLLYFFLFYHLPFYLILYSILFVQIVLTSFIWFYPICLLFNYFSFFLSFFYLYIFFLRCN